MKKKMSMRTFIRSNRKDIDEVIRDAAADKVLKINDVDREETVINIESLYTWAQSSGVDT